MDIYQKKVTAIIDPHSAELAIAIVTHNKQLVFGNYTAFFNTDDRIGQMVAATDKRMRDYIVGRFCQ